MEVSMLAMAIEALQIIFDPMRLMFLFLGVLMGLVFGVIPGIGGLVGLALLLPFTFTLDPYAGLAMLIGLGSVTATSDSIPAILFGVPGTSGAAATVMDGHPMARKGEASRAFGAAFTSSLIGGLFGALLLGLSIPFLRPVMLSIGTPEMLAITIFGLTLVASLGGKNAMKGIIAACIGLSLAMIGEERNMGEWRWMFGSLYLWEGLPIVPVALGLFALPELADLAIRRARVTTNVEEAARSSQWQGAKDAISRPFLMARCSGIGSLIGAIPGLGSAVVDWIAYGHALRTEKGASETFGKGDVRGVIATESANNSKEGGALVTTVAFGVPGSASMALLLSAFAVFGIVPGPDMLGKDLDVTYSIVWSVAIANILGASICFLFVGWLAKIALVRPGILVPVILAITFIGAYQASNSWGDLYVLISMGLLGFLMKRTGWARPPLILGFVLGGIFERYLFTSTTIYGMSWMLRPVVLILLIMAAYGLLNPLFKAAMRQFRENERRKIRFGLADNINWLELSFSLALLAVFIYTLVSSLSWHIDSRLVPNVISWTAIVALGIFILARLFVQIEAPEGGAGENMSMDLSGEYEGIDTSTVTRRALIYFGWILFYFLLAWVVGLLPAMGLFAFLYMRVTGRERLLTALLIATALFALSYFLFHFTLNIAWPNSLIGQWFPEIRDSRLLRIF
jgi:TctA family transporter